MPFNNCYYNILILFNIEYTCISHCRQTQGYVYPYRCITALVWCAGLYRMLWQVLLACIPLSHLILRLVWRVYKMRGRGNNSEIWSQCVKSGRNTSTIIKLKWPKTRRHIVLLLYTYGNEADKLQLCTRLLWHWDFLDNQRTWSTQFDCTMIWPSPINTVYFLFRGWSSSFDNSDVFRFLDVIQCTVRLQCS